MLTLYFLCPNSKTTYTSSSFRVSKIIPKIGRLGVRKRRKSIPPAYHTPKNRPPGVRNVRPKSLNNKPFSGFIKEENRVIISCESCDAIYKYEQRETLTWRTFPRSRLTSADMSSDFLFSDFKSQRIVVSLALAAFFAL